jgi:hypothetical protein
MASIYMQAQEQKSFGSFLQKRTFFIRNNFVSIVSDLGSKACHAFKMLGVTRSLHLDVRGGGVDVADVVGGERD